LFVFDDEHKLVILTCDQFCRNVLLENKAHCLQWYFSCTVYFQMSFLFCFWVLQTTIQLNILWTWKTL